MVSQDGRFSDLPENVDTFQRGTILARAVGLAGAGGDQASAMSAHVTMAGKNSDAAHAQRYASKASRER